MTQASSRWVLQRTEVAAISRVNRLLRELRKTLYVFGDESGTFQSAPYFALGVLLTRDPDRHEKRIHELRREHEYRPELKYSRNDKFKVPFARDLIDYFWSDPDLDFRCLVIDNSQHELDRFDSDEEEMRAEDIAYNYRYRKLIERNTPRHDELVLFLDDRTRANEDNLPQYLRDQIDNLKSLHLVDSQKHQLIQLADLFTGSVYGDATDITNDVKRALIRRIKSHLRVRSLLDRNLGQNRKFSVDVWRPPREERDGLNT